jgi:hypothetical protein
LRRKRFIGSKTLKIFLIYTEKVNIHHPGNCILGFFRGSSSWESSYDHNIMGNKPGVPITEEFLGPRYIHERGEFILVGQ